MTFTCGIGTPGTIDARQNRKSWAGSKYGLYNETVDGRRRDFPVEPWMVWYDNASGSDPSVGIIADVNPVGWEVLSLAVNGMGDNTMLQQILREGHQGDFFVMPDGDHFIYDYTIYTSAYGSNFTEIRSLSMQVNQPISQSTGEQELYAHNILTCITKDVANSNISNVTIYIYNSTSDLIRFGTTEAATITFLKLPSDSYTIVSNYTLLSTYGGSITFTVYDRFVNALQLHSFGTLGIEIVLSAFTPLLLATATAVQAFAGFVVASPVVGYCSAGYPIHHGFGKWLVSIIPLHIGKGDDNIVEQILFVLCLCLVSEAGSYLVIGKPLTLKLVVAVAIVVVLLSFSV